MLFSYNHEPFLRACVAGVLNQTFTDFELIVLDDHSTDGSWELLREFSDPRIRTVRAPQNLAAEWMYDGIDRFGTGEYIAVHNSDDLWLPQKLEKQVRYLDGHAECDAVFTDVSVIDERGAPYDAPERFYTDAFQLKNEKSARRLRDFFYRGNDLCASSVMMRRSLFRKAEMRQHGIFSVPDLIQWVRVCSVSEIHVYPEKLSCYRVRDQEKNISADTDQGHIRFAFENLILLAQYLKLTDERFLEVFPEAGEYVRPGGFVKRYAYARILLQAGQRGEYRLLALLLLYGLLNDDETREALRALYGFTHRDFVKLSGRLDVFRVIPESAYLQCSLFYKTGAQEDYSAERRFSKRVYIARDGSFFFTMELDGARASSLRFDPDEGRYRCFQELQFLLDGQKAAFVPASPARETEQGILFCSSDPQLQLTLPQERALHTLEVRGRAALIPLQQLDGLLRAGCQAEAGLERLHAQLYELDELLSLGSQLSRALTHAGAAPRELEELLARGIELRAGLAGVGARPEELEELLGLGTRLRAGLAGVGAKPEELEELLALGKQLRDHPVKAAARQFRDRIAFRGSQAERPPHPGP